MYIPQITASRIKKIAKEKKIPVSTILKETNVSKGTITKMANGADINVQTISKIAEYLKCSIDYLVGNTMYEEQTTEEIKLIEEFRSVTEDGKKAIMKQVMYISNDEQYKKYTDVPKEA